MTPEIYPARNMFTTIVIDAFTAEGDPERYDKTYQVCCWWLGFGW